MRLRQLFRGSASKMSLSDFYQTLYPEDVRYALSQKQARLGKAELNSLTGRFVYEAVYLVTKALTHSPEKQRQYLEDLTRIYRHADYHLDDLRNFLQTNI